jgi:hypothetical protein
MRNTGICLMAIALGLLALSGCSREGADWKSATTADTAEAYQQFLQQHPKSPNAAQAQARIQQIADDHDWQTAAAADTRDAYEQFVAQHPDSKWAQEARIRIENFAQSGATSGKVASANAATPNAAAPAGPATTASQATMAPPGTAEKAAPAHGAGKAHAGAAVASAKGGHEHFVQLGAYHSKARAESEWKTLSAKYPSELKSLKPHFVAAKSKTGPVYKLRVEVPSASDATGLCTRLKKHSQVCVPVTA